MHLSSFLAVPLAALAACSDAHAPFPPDAASAPAKSVKEARDATVAEIAHQASIRRTISADASISPSSKLVQVITLAGRVILRGTVATPADRERIEDLARLSSATREIDNMIAVVRR